MLLLLFIYGGISPGPPPVRGGRHATRRLIFRRPEDEDALVMIDLI